MATLSPALSIGRRLPALVAAVILVAYCMMRYGDSVLSFFYLDDFWLLRDAARTHVQSVVDLAFLFRFNHVGFELYRPLTQAVYFFLLHAAFGTDASGYHFVQLAAFATNTILVMAIARRISGSLLIGLCVALLYAAAPGHSVAVFWIAAFSMTGTALAVFTMVLWWQRSAGLRRLIGSAVLQVIALLSSEHAVVAPFLLLAVSAFSMTRESWRQMARDLSGPFTIVGLYIGLKVTYFHIFGWPQFGYQMRFDPAVWFEEIGRYVFASINLQNVLRLDQQTASVFGRVVCLSAVIATIAALRGAERWRLLALGIDFFLVALAPVLPLTVHQYDYFVGIAAFGSALAVIGLLALVGGARNTSTLATIVTVVFLVASARSTDLAARNNHVFTVYGNWSKDSETLILNLGLCCTSIGPRTEVLVPSTPQNRSMIERGQAGEVFFNPPLRVTVALPENLAHPEPFQLALPHPTAMPRGNNLPFWWETNLDWIRLWVPLPRAWYRHVVGLP